MTATASSQENSSYPASYAVDGSRTTRWSSAYSNSQWIRADLGRLRQLSRVRLYWEVAYGAQYKFQVSNNGTTWTDAPDTNGNVIQYGAVGKVDTLLAPVTARYVRMLGIARGTGYGYSIWEFEVYATDQDETLWWPFDECFSGYGDGTAKVTAADYDGDGITDLSIKGSDGVWYIDYSSQAAPDGRRFGQWNAVLPGYGNSTVTPVPADYDGDGRADPAIKGTDGAWFMDVSSDWGNPACMSPNPPCFGGWNLMLWGSQAIYGDAAVVPVPADYDGDLKADIAVKWPTGQWAIDFANNGFGSIDHWVSSWGSAWKGIPGRWNNDPYADIAIKQVWSMDVDSRWYVNFSPANGRADNVNDQTNTIKQ
jgi:hypothetical protein